MRLFWVVENDVFLVDWIFFWRGNADSFPEAEGFFRGLKLFPVNRVSCQGVRDFPGTGRLSFFSGGGSIFFGGGGEYIVKLAFSHDKVLQCILQDALI